MRLPKRQKIQLNCLLGLGVITALACIVRTAFSYEVKQPDVTWQGVPNAICRMVEVNTGISAACMPMMRTLFISLKKRHTQRQSGSLSSSNTAADDLHFYTPPTQTPWYMRIKRSLWQSPPEMEMVQDSKGFQSEHSLPQFDFNVEKLLRPPILSRRSTPKLVPKVRPPLKRSKSPRLYEGPENATWARNDLLSKNNSFDLPIQGPRKKGWDAAENTKGEVEEAGFGNYKYHRNWL